MNKLEYTTLEAALARIKELEERKDELKKIALELVEENKRLKYDCSKLFGKHERATAKLAEILGW